MDVAVVGCEGDRAFERDQPDSLVAVVDPGGEIPALVSVRELDRPSTPFRAWLPFVDTYRILSILRRADTVWREGLTRLAQDLQF
jgi:hypothetical protein